MRALSWIALGKLDTLDTQALTQKAVDTALGKLGGEAAPTGVYPVVFDPEAMSDLLGVFSGVFSSEAAQKGLSKFAKAEEAPHTFDRTADLSLCDSGACAVSEHTC